MDKVYKIGKKKDARSDDSGGQVVRILVRGTEGSGFKPHSCLRNFSRERKKKKVKVFGGVGVPYMTVL